MAHKDRKKKKYHRVKDGEQGLFGYCNNQIKLYGETVYIWFDGLLGHCAVSEVLEENGFKIDFVQVMKYSKKAKSGKGMVFCMYLRDLLAFKVNKNKKSVLEKPEPIKKTFEPKIVTRKPKYDRKILEDGKIAWFDSSGKFVAWEPE